jgi:hypothetical protein
MNDKRDSRERKEQAEILSDQQKEDARAREQAADFFNNSQDLADTTPTGGPAPAVEVKAAPRHTETVQDSVPDDSKTNHKDNKKR